MGSVMKKDLQIKAKEFRKRGYSIKELKELLGVSKSTISTWIKDVQLSEEAQNRLRNNYTNGQIASQKTIKEKTRQKNIEADDFAMNTLKPVNFSSEVSLLLCAILYQCEGSKSIKDAMTFTNSDPDLISTFISLLRNSFDLDEKKFRVLMHLHKYHNEKTQKDFWSKITNIPKEQFNKSYLKPSNGKYKKEGYQGCIQVRYRDVIIGRNLQAVAKKFMERYK